MLTQSHANPVLEAPALQDGPGRCFPLIMTESELAAFLRIPEVSGAEDPRHVIEWLKRARGLPCFHLCRKALYFRPAVLEWIQEQVTQERKK